MKQSHIRLNLVIRCGAFHKSNTDNNSQTNDETVTYTVKSGDTLWGISQKFQVSVPQITSLNHISDSNIIYVGQVLVIVTSFMLVKF